MFLIVIREHGSTVFQAELGDTLEVGRQVDGDPQPYGFGVRDGVKRLVLAARSEVHISRRWLRIEHVNQETLRLTNLSTGSPVVVERSPLLLPGQSLEITSLAKLAVGVRSVIIGHEEAIKQGLPEGYGSVSLWLEQLKSGEDSRAAAGLWDRFFQRLETAARQRLARSRAGRVVDGEDIALDVLDRLLRGISEGRFAGVNRRDDLWKLLVTLTRQRVIDEHRHHRAARRGGGLVRGDSMFANTEGGGGLDGLFGEDLPPSTLVEIDENYRQLLSSIPDESSRRIVELRMEGYSNEEIAGVLGISLRTVERRLTEVRARWADQGLSQC